MDKEQEQMRFLGLFGIYKESHKIILSWRKIFSQITLTLILPLSFIFLFHMEVSDILFRKIRHNAEQMKETPKGTPQYNKLSNINATEGATLLLFKLVYFTFFLIFSLLSTSAVVYTIASIYTAREVNFRKVMSVVPKVWARLMTTFLCAFVAFLFYNFVALLVFIILAFTLIGVEAPQNSGVAKFAFIGVLLYIAGFMYLNVLWHLASVVTVLEDSYGFEAMRKSKDLIKGKTGLSMLIFFMLYVSFFLIQFLFMKVVVLGWSLSSVEGTAYGFLCFLLLSHLFLFELVVQTVLYFVCKSYHHQNIDKSALSIHLEVYLGEYEPLTAKDVQLQQCHV